MTEIRLSTAKPALAAIGKLLADAVDRAAESRITWVIDADGTRLAAIVPANLGVILEEAAVAEVKTALGFRAEHPVRLKGYDDDEQDRTHEMPALQRAGASPGGTGALAASPERHDHA